MLTKNFNQGGDADARVSRIARLHRKGGLKWTAILEIGGHLAISCY